MNPEALRRIEAVRQSSATKLDLSGLKLEAVPDALADLEQLEHLNLDYNLLSDLPVWFTRLSRLEQLSIGNNDLIAIPSVLQSLPNVSSLALNDNRISGFPDWLQEMSQLQAFLIYGNPVLNPMPLRSLVRQLV